MSARRPSRAASTVPSPRFVTQPVTFRALRRGVRIVSRKKTPCTLAVDDDALAADRPGRTARCLLVLVSRRRIRRPGWRAGSRRARPPRRRATGRRRARASPCRRSRRSARSRAGSSRNRRARAPGCRRSRTSCRSRRRRCRPARPPRGKARSSDAPGGTSIQFTDRFREPSSPASMRMCERRRCTSMVGASEKRRTSTRPF